MNSNEFDQVSQVFAGKSDDFVEGFAAGVAETVAAIGDDIGVSLLMTLSSVDVMRDFLAERKARASA